MGGDTEQRKNINYYNSDELGVLFLFYMRKESGGEEGKKVARLFLMGKE